MHLEIHLDCAKSGAGKGLVNDGVKLAEIFELINACTFNFLPISSSASFSIPDKINRTLTIILQQVVICIVKG